MKKSSALFILLCGCAFAVSGVYATERYARFEHAGEVKHGVVRDNDLLVLSAGLFPMSQATDETISLDNVTLLPPTRPSKVFAVGMNFASHRASKSSKPPPVFLKLPSSLTGHNATINFPKGADNVHFEGELVLVIGKTAKNISQEQAAEYIFGVTVGNDLTERSWQRRDLQWLRAKASDGFGPVGPFIATDLDYSDVLLTTRLNDDVVQQESTKNMIHSPAKVVSYLSQYFTLEPGDLVFMGTPGKTKALDDGDVVSVEIEGIGTIVNTINVHTD